MGVSGSLLRTGSVLTLALVFGGLAAYSTQRLLEESTPMLEVPLDRHAIDSITPDGAGVRIVLAGGRAFFVDTADDRRNARNIALLYPGKHVTLTPSAAVLAETSPDDCAPIVPVPETAPPALAPERYRQLIAAGFSDAELAVSWELPEGETNHNPTPAVGGVAARFAGIVCADPPPPES